MNPAWKGGHGGGEETATNGTSGFEDEVVAAIRPYAEGLGEITEERMRNLYIRCKENNGKRPVVQLDEEQLMSF